MRELTVIGGAGCSQCLLTTRMLDGIKAKYTYVPHNEVPELVKEHNITSIPVLIVKEDDVVVDKAVGMQTVARLEELVNG
ncbi:MAG: thioredoxin family protein [Planctomycetes bacterium]|nr:thioredoxin family protein [Planctomycetota bacterium]